MLLSLCWLLQLESKLTSSCRVAARVSSFISWKPYFSCNQQNREYWLICFSLPSCQSFFSDQMWVLATWRNHEWNNMVCNWVEFLSHMLNISVETKYFLGNNLRSYFNPSSSTVYVNRHGWNHRKMGTHTNNQRHANMQCKKSQIKTHRHYTHFDVLICGSILTTKYLREHKTNFEFYLSLQTLKNPHPE